MDRLQLEVQDAKTDKTRGEQQIKQLELTFRQLMVSKDSTNRSGPGQTDRSGKPESRREHYIVMEDQIEDLSVRLREAEGALEQSKQELEQAIQREERTNDKLLATMKQVEEKSRETTNAQAELVRLQRESHNLQDAPLLRAQMAEADRQLQKAIAREGAVEVQLSGRSSGAASSRGAYRRRRQRGRRRREG